VYKGAYLPEGFALVDTIIKKWSELPEVVAPLFKTLL
jgi:hypothetical protein